MVEGYFREVQTAAGAQVWPMVNATLSIPELGFTGQAEFLIDTGSEGSTLGASAAAELGIDVTRLGPTSPVRGAGGATPAVVADAEVMLGAVIVQVKLHIMVPRRDQKRWQRGVPSCLGRDVLSHFTLVLDLASRRLELLHRE